MTAEIESAERSVSGWRIVASAWIVAIMVVALFATVGAVASLHSTAPRTPALAGAVIPRHDSSFPGPDEVAASDWLERARAEAYYGW